MVNISHGYYLHAIEHVCNKTMVSRACEETTYHGHLSPWLKNIEFLFYCPVQMCSCFWGGIGVSIKISVVHLYLSGCLSDTFLGMLHSYGAFINITLCSHLTVLNVCLSVCTHETSQGLPGTLYWNFLFGRVTDVNNYGFGKNQVKIEILLWRMSCACVYAYVKCNLLHIYKGENSLE